MTSATLREAAVTKMDGSYPGYINAHRTDSGSVFVTLRGDPQPHAAKLGMTASMVATITFSQEEWLAFLQAAIGI